MITAYKIHFSDNYGSGTIECEPQDFDHVMANVKADAYAENVWVESFDDEEGWQA